MFLLSRGSLSLCAASFAVRTARTTTTRRVRLRNATLDDLELLQGWDEQDYLQNPNVMGDQDYNEWNWQYELARKDDDSSSWRYQLIAEALFDIDNEANDSVIPIGFVQLIDPVLEETNYWGCNNTILPNTVLALDIWIGNANYLGRGYGTEIMHRVLQDYCFDNNNRVQVVWVDPMATNTAAHRFYQKLGFQPVGIRHFGPDECLVHKLTRQEYQRGR